MINKFFINILNSGLYPQWCRHLLVGWLFDLESTFSLQWNLHQPQHSRLHTPHSYSHLATWPPRKPSTKQLGFSVLRHLPS